MDIFEFSEIIGGGSDGISTEPRHAANGGAVPALRSAVLANSKGSVDDRFRLPLSGLSVMVRAKYHRGRQHPQRWVFGVYDPEARHGFIQLVRRRDARTLLPIIRRVVAPGTTVWSDEWRAYAQLGTLGYVHQTVNHSRNFTDPVTGVCTNHVEAYWCAIKRRFKRMVGTRSQLVPSYLDEHMWRERYGRTSTLAFVNMQRHIAERYPLQ